MKRPFLFGLLFALSCIPRTAPAQVLASQSNWLAGWTWREPVTNFKPINAGGAEILTNFPVLLRFSNDVVVKNARADGGDLTFADLNGVQLFHEIESLDQPNGHLAVWVCFPLLTNNSQVYLYSSNTNALMPFNGSNQQEKLSGTYANLRTEPAIWTRTWESNFYAVLHFTNGPGNPPTDSTRWSNQFQYVANGASLMQAQAAGIAGAGMFSPFSANQDSGLMSPSNSFMRDPGYLTNKPSTTSMWFKPTAFPSNYAPSTNSFNESFLFQLTGQFVVKSTNDIANRGSLGILHDGANSLSAGVAIANVVVPNALALNQWGFYSLSGSWTPSGANNVATVRLAVNDSVSTTASTNSYALNYAGDLRLMTGPAGTVSTATPTIKQYSPSGYFDEFRHSTVLRSSNWQLSTYTNALSGTNGGFFTLGRAENYETGWSFTLSNPDPVQWVTNVAGQLGYGVSNAVIVRGSWSNYITNITFIVSNPYTFASVAVVSNYPQGASFLGLDWTFPTAGTWYLIAKPLDFMNLSPPWITNALTVNAVPYADLSSLRVTQGDGGFLVDLFGAPTRYGNFGAYQLTATRDGKPTDLSYCSNSTWMDSSGVFYGVKYNYQFTLRWSGGPSYSASATARGADPGSLQWNIPGSSAAARRSFEWQIAPPVRSASRVVNMALPSLRVQSADRLSDLALRQRIFYENDLSSSDPWGNGPAVVTAWIAISNQRALFPELPSGSVDGSRLARFALGFWDGRNWIPRATTFRRSGDAVALTAGLPNQGRYAVLYNPEFDLSGIGDSQVVVSGRMVSFAGGGVVSVSFPNPKSLSVTFHVEDIHGREVWRREGLTGSSCQWDGASMSGASVAPGVYLWVVQVGGASASTYQGSLLVVR